MVMVNPGINSNGIDLIAVTILLLVFALIYPPYLSKVYSKIKNWGLYSLFIWSLLIANGILLALKLTLVTSPFLISTLIFTLGHLLLIITRRNNQRSHVLLVELYTLFLAINIIVYYLL